MSKMIRRIEPTEHETQSSFFEWVNTITLSSPIFFGNVLPLRKVLFSIPNGGFRHIFTAKKQKKEGLLAGVLDIFLAFPNKGKHGMWIEFKTKKGILSEGQKSFIVLMEFLGYPCVVARSVDEGIQAIKDYLGMK